MAVKSSLVLNSQTKPCNNKVCKACGLYLNQAPIFDRQQKSSVFWVGLSAVLFDKDAEKLPLSPLTASGGLIHQIESSFRQTLNFYKTNLVKCVPMNNDRIRYPLAHEMEKCFPNFEWELEQLNPRTVFLLGKQVATFVLKKMNAALPVLDENFNYQPILAQGINFVPIHHPSYILVYKRKKLANYVQSIQQLFPSHMTSTVITNKMKRRNEMHKTIDKSISIS